MNGWTLPKLRGQRLLDLVDFWDGSCDNGNCGAGILIMACSGPKGWSPIYKKCGPVLGFYSWDAELERGGGKGEGSMQMDNFKSKD